MKNWMAPNDTALLRVDIQTTFGPNGKLPVAEGDQIVVVVNGLSMHFRVRGDTQDWHPEGHSSFASTHGVEPYSIIQMPYGPQTAWPDHGIADTEDADFIPGLRRNVNDFLIHKGTNKDIDSYSGFFENDQKTQPRMEDGRTLAEYLRSIGIKRVVIVGLAYDFCVGWNALDAVKEGFQAIVVKDATRGIGIPLEGGKTTMDAMDAQLKEAGVIVTDSKSLPAVLGVNTRPAPSLTA